MKAKLKDLKRELWLFFHDPKRNIYSCVYLYTFVVITLVSAILIMLESVPSIYVSGKIPLEEIDYAIYSIFTLDFILRGLVAPSWKAFCYNFYNIIDFLSLLPFYLQFIFEIGDKSFMQLIYLLRPPIRLLTLSRNFFGFRLLAKSLSRSIDSLTIPMFLLFLMVVTGGIFVYFFEHETNPLIDSIPQAMYLAVATISTVGFGDVYPITVAGKITVSVLIITGVMYMAMPLAIVGSNFLQVWEDRDRILLVRRIKDRLVQYGFSPNDLVHAFRSCDSDLDGDIDIDEFSVLIKSLGLGLSHNRIVDLFMSFDTDENGQLRLAEFARAIFPNHIWTDDELRAKEVELFSRDTLTVRHPSVALTTINEGFVDNVMTEGTESIRDRPPVAIPRKVSFVEVEPTTRILADMQRRMDELAARLDSLTMQN